ncbi:transposase [Bacillus sp. HMF5848]|nr:transposase [Bacillus sp. HMF5848]RSK26862.1 transposase [Bacillus sp. HMF5848]
MMLKVILFAYANKIYTSRKMADQLTQNIYFMWLSGNKATLFPYQ